MKCPSCGSTHLVKSGKNDLTGHQRYLCKDCGRKSSGEYSMQRFKDVNTEIHCPRCGSLKIKKHGFSRVNKYRTYECTICHKQFCPEAKPKHLTAKEKKLIVFYHQNFGVSVTSLAKSIKRNEKTIRNFLKEYYKVDALPNRRNKVFIKVKGEAK